MPGPENEMVLRVKTLLSVGNGTKACHSGRLSHLLVGF